MYVFLSYTQALLGGGHQIDLAVFQKTLWDTLTQGDRLMVRPNTLSIDYVTLQENNLILIVK